jgi:DNA-binding NarL/FixJ family response regulator
MELCAALRSDRRAPEVVIYTATTATGLEALAHDAGARAVVEKSADLDRLFDALRLAARAGRAVRT